MQVVGVDGLRTASRCARMRFVAISNEETARGTNYPNWHGYVKACFPAARCERCRSACVAQEAAPLGNDRFFEKLPTTMVAIEACGSSHHSARLLGALGHEVKLIAPQLSKPYVKRGKNDAADAEALCEAMSRPTMRFVPVKSAEQQASLMLTGMRDRLVRNRTQLANAIRGYAAEFGLTAAKGMYKVELVLDRIAIDPAIPALARELFASHAVEYQHLDEQIDEIDEMLMKWHRANECSRLAQIPGVGPVGAALLMMKTPAPELFASGRQFAAWMGLTPKDHSTAGKSRPGIITRAGDEALRCTLVVGATSLLQHVRAGRGRTAHRGCLSCSSANRRSWWRLHWPTRWLALPGR